MEKQQPPSKGQSPALRRAIKKFQAQFSGTCSMDEAEIVHTDNSMDNKEKGMKSDDD